jgi:hypothetical protein
MASCMVANCTTRWSDMQRSMWTLKENDGYMQHVSSIACIQLKIYSSRFMITKERSSMMWCLWCRWRIHNTTKVDVYDKQSYPTTSTLIPIRHDTSTTPPNIYTFRLTSQWSSTMSAMFLRIRDYTPPTRSIHSRKHNNNTTPQTSTSTQHTTNTALQLDPRNLTQYQEASSSFLIPTIQ